MIADTVFDFLERGVKNISQGTIGPRLARSAMETAGSVRRVPFLRDLFPVTPDSPLHLFDQAQYQKAFPTVGGGNYFAGRSVHMQQTQIPGGTMGPMNYGLTAPDPRVARNRMIGAGALVGLMGANLLGVDPMGVTSAGTTVAALGVHGFVGSTLYRAGGKTRMLGMGYLAALGINTLRSGDNLGPM